MLIGVNWRAEWLLVRRHPLVWAVVIPAIAFIALAAGNETPRDGRAFEEALLRLNLFIPAFVLPFVAGALAPVFFLRESAHRMHELLTAYPQTRRDWLIVRLGFLAALLVATCAIQQAVILGVLGASDPALRAGLAWRTVTLMAWAHLPACLIWTCVLAWVSAATGKAGMVYFAAAFGWAAYLGIATLSGSPLIAGSFVAWEPLRQMLIVADPYAITALVNPPPLSGFSYAREASMVLGRIFWLALCFALLRGIARVPLMLAAEQDAPRWPVWMTKLGLPRPRGAGLFGLLLRWAMFDKFLLLALVGWALLVFPEVFSGMRYVEQLAVVDPDSRDALNRVIWDLVPPLGALVLLYEADRVSRLTGIARASDLVAATPVASWRLLVAQLACLWLIAALLLGFTLLIVLAAQLAAGSPVNPHEYLAQAGQALPGLLLWAALFLSIHATLRSRMAANLIGMALFVLGNSSLAPAMGLAHPLWKILAIPLAEPDHLLGFDANWAVLWAYGSTWMALCCGLFLLAIALHHRGTDYRQRSLRQVLRHPGLLLAAPVLAVGVWQAVAVHRTLAADYSLISSDERARRKADYELRYAEWQGKPQPEVAVVRSNLDFGDDGHSVELRAAMTLVNRTDRTIGQILAGRNETDLAGAISIDGARPEVRDQVTGQSVFRLLEPMRPGETRVLQFNTRIARSALSGSDGLLVLRPGFAVVPAFQILPVIGFRREFTLRDPARRSRFGLPPLVNPAPSRLGPVQEMLAGEQARFETVMSVPAGQTGLAPGELTRKWRANGRDHFAYRTDRPIRNLPMFLAVSCAPQPSRVGAVSAEIYAPGTIRRNDPNLLGMHDTLAWLDRAVAPYPGKTLRLIAVPEVGPSGFAFPQGILISHRRGFRAKPAPTAEFDQAYRRAVHETAHQWFGHLLGYGITDERAFMVESLAKYAELVMVERRYGTKAMRALVAWEASRFAHARLVPAETTIPLIDAEDTEDMYSRATLAFACLRERVGDEAIIAALQDVATKTLETGRSARSLDFVMALKHSAGPDLSPVVALLLVDPTSLEVAMARAGCSKSIGN